MRKGTLTDAQTLGMYEDGVSIVALCVHEGMTCYGVIGRLTRARRQRRKEIGLRRAAHVRAVSNRARYPQPAYDTFDALQAAVRRLQQATKEMTRA